MSEKVQLVTDVTRVAVGSVGTAAVWMTDLDVEIRIGVGLATIIYLVIAIIHRLQNWRGKSE